MAADDHPLKGTCELWCKIIAKAKQVKERLFGQTARECQAFYDGPHDFMYGTKNAMNSIGMYLDGAAKIKTTFKVTTNKVAEIVQRFGPSMYFNNPNRLVAPRKPIVSPQALQFLGSPQNQFAAQQAMMLIGQRVASQGATAELMEWLLNFTPGELDLQQHSRLGITEALIKGLGVAWTEIYQPDPMGPRMVGTFYDSCDRLILDPDCDTFENAKFIVRECCHPVWEVEDEYGLPRGSLKGTTESAQMAGLIEDTHEYNRQRFEGKTNDVLVYYKIWSRMGIGGRLKGADQDLQEILDTFGDNVFLVVSKGTPFPLNFPPESMNVDMADPAGMEQVMSRLRWGIPFHADNCWPVSELGFHSVPGSPYPMSHLKPGLGELRFINWCMSFLADKVRITSRDWIVVMQELEKEVKLAITEGDSLEVIPLKRSMAKSINEVVQFLQHPPMNKDILDILQMAMMMFDKRVGLTELMYGIQATQSRSATDTQVKQKMTTIVVDDMAQRTQAWQTKIARKEGIAARWMMSPADVAPLFGEQFSMGDQGDPMQMIPPTPPVIGPMTSMWQMLCYRPPDFNNPASLAEVCRELDFTIEADSLRQPDTERDIANIDQLMQSAVGQAMVGRYMATGDPTQVNAILQSWCKPRKLDPTPFLFPPFIPPPPAPPGQEGSGPPQQGVAA